MSRMLKSLFGITAGALSCFSIPDGQAIAMTAPVCGACTPTVTGGGVVANAEVVPIFWGPWPDGQPNGGQVLGAVQAMLNGPYLGALAQYGVNPARMSPMTPVYTAQPPPSSGFNIGNVIPAVINAEITAGVVPTPATGTDIVYVVLLPANVTGCASSTCNAHGFNGASTYPPNGAAYRWAFVTGDQSITGFTSYSSTFSHELVEALAVGVNVAGCGAADQISDICQCNTENQLQGGMTLQAYWSVADGKCVIPEAWNGIYSYQGTPGNWLRIGEAARQVYAGNGGVIATDTNDNSYYYTTATNQFTLIGGPGAMFANGADGVVALAADLSFVAR